jgi:hypothetical protein
MPLRSIGSALFTPKRFKSVKWLVCYKSGVLGSVNLFPLCDPYSLILKIFFTGESNLFRWLFGCGVLVISFLGMLFGKMSFA